MVIKMDSFILTKVSKKSNKINLISFNCLLLTIFSCFYLTQFPTLSIVIVVFPLFIEMLLFIIFNHKLRLNVCTILSMIMILLTMVYQYFWLRNEECLSFVFSLLYFLIMFISFEHIEKRYLEKLSKVMLLFAAFILTLDAIYRFLNPRKSVFAIGEYAFYKYKGEGIIFNDTNNTGMLVLTCLGFLFYLSYYFDKSFILFKIVFTILLVLTFCRAAIFMYLICIPFLIRKIPVSFKIVLLVLIAMVGLLFYNRITDYLLSDASTEYKINVFSSTLDYINSKDLLTLFFGIGFTNSIKEFGTFTHSWPLTFFIEFGFIGFILILLFWFSICYITDYKALYVLAPFLLAGLSYFPLLCPYLYSACIFIYYLEKRKKECVNYECNSVYYNSNV